MNKSRYKRSQEIQETHLITWRLLESDAVLLLGLARGFVTASHAADLAEIGFLAAHAICL